ncbi:putative pantothenate transporter [Paraphoma chrysanthemicola]|nr:putative pantothenate transporter [Paraphoma chrysanthemicola]
MSGLKNKPTASSAPAVDVPGDGFHYARRGSIPNEEGAAGEINGYDAERMRARTLLTVEEEKTLLRRIDLRLMTLCSIMFLLKNIDADNVSNARIMNRGTPSNIMTQLGMSSNEYNLVTTMYYIPYILAEAPSNLVIKRLLPSRWQSRIMVTWGIALACHAAVKNKEGLYAVRFLLGLFEAGMFPGVILQMCYWYRPDEMSVRLLYFYILGNLSGVISGVLAFAFSHLDGAHGLSGWQWLFLVEAIITIAFGIALYWILPDFPPQAKWLSEKEKAFIQARLPGNAPQASEANFSWREILDVLKDVRLWLFTLIWALMTIGTSGVRFYQPTVIADLGYTDIASAQLLNLPISILSIVVIGVTGAFADNGRLPRPLYPLTFLGIILISYGVLYAYPSTGGVFAATIIGNSVTSAWYPMMWPWRAQSCAKATGSAFSIGFVNSYGQIGGAIGPHLFQSRYAPHYGVSFGIAMGFVSACILTTSFTWYLTRGTEGDTRRLKVARVKAQKRGETILDDVVDNDLNRLRAGKESEASI